MSTDGLRAVGTAVLYVGGFLLAVALVVHRLDAILGRGGRARPWYVAVFLGPTLVLVSVGLASSVMPTRRAWRPTRPVRGC